MNMTNVEIALEIMGKGMVCLFYTSPSTRD